MSIGLGFALLCNLANVDLKPHPIFDLQWITSVFTYDWDRMSVELTSGRYCFDDGWRLSFVSVPWQSDCHANLVHYAWSSGYL